MSVKIRLARHGAKKSPFYRVVVADERSRRNGRNIELVGRYDPRSNPSIVDLDLEKIDGWLAKGAQPTEAAQKLIAIARGEKAAPEKAIKPSKRSQAKAEAEAAEKEEAAAAAVVEESADEAPAEEVEEAQVPAEEVVEEIPVEEMAVEEVPAEEVVEEAVAEEVAE